MCCCVEVLTCQVGKHMISLELTSSAEACSALTRDPRSRDLLEFADDEIRMFWVTFPLRLFIALTADRQHLFEILSNFQKSQFLMKI